MKFAIVFTVLALALYANTLSITGHGLKGPIFVIAQSTPQSQAGLEKEAQTLAEKAPVTENYTTPIESKSETQSEREDPVTRIDSELAHETTEAESQTELEKPDIAVEPSFLNKSPKPNILDPYRLL